MKKTYVLFVLILLCLLINGSFVSAKTQTPKVAFIAFEMNKQDYNLQWTDGFIKNISANKTYKKIQFNNINSKAPSVKFNASKVENPDLIIDLYNADSNQDTFLSMIKTIKEKKYDVLVAITTKEALAAKDAGIVNTPVIFTSSYPNLIIKNMIIPEANFTGVSVGISVDVKLQKLKELVPHLKTLGYVYTPNDGMQEALAKDVVDAKNRLNYEVYVEKVLVEKTAPDKEKVDKLKAATKALIDKKVDAIFYGSGQIMTSPLMIEPLDMATAAKVPTQVNDTQQIGYGALLAVNTKAPLVGAEAWNMTSKVLEGVAISKLPVRCIPTPEVDVNLKVAKKLKMKIDEEFLFQADKVIEK